MFCIEPYSYWNIYQSHPICIYLQLVLIAKPIESVFKGEEFIIINIDKFSKQDLWLCDVGLGALLISHVPGFDGSWLIDRDEQRGSFEGRNWDYLGLMANKLSDYNGFFFKAVEFDDGVKRRNCEELKVVFVDHVLSREVVF